MKNTPSIRKSTVAGIGIICFIAGLLVMFVAMQFVVPAILASGSNAVPENIVPESAEWFAWERSYSKNHACIEITHSDNPVKPMADERYEDGYGWNYTHYLTEVNGFDFYPESYTEYYIKDGMATGHTSYNADDMITWWGANKIPALDMMTVRGGMPVQNLSGLGLKITGRDAKGTELEFYGYMEFSQE